MILGDVGPVFMVINCFLSNSNWLSRTWTSSSFSLSCFWRLRISDALSRIDLISIGKAS